MSEQIELHVSMSEVLEQISDDDLIDEIRRRDLEDCFDSNDDELDEYQIREQEYNDLKKNNHALPKLFDRFQLRDHLISIAGIGSYSSDKKLFDTLSDLLEYS